jgi:isopenicillin-N N-acyltransferase-like protein
VVAGGRHIVGHNMDWYVIDAVNNVLFDLTGPDGTRIMGLAGAPYLLMLGMNSHGVGNVSNSVHSNDNRVGVPNTFVRRATLEARTLEEARDRGLLAARARGTNQFFADAGGRLWDLETSATSHALMDHTGAGFMAHTNHYVSPELLSFEGYAGGESEVRLSTAERLLREGFAAEEDPLELVARVLRTHEPSPAEAICGHADPDEEPAEQGMTVGSIICDLDERRLYACAGAPCENQYQVFEMGDA